MTIYLQQNCKYRVTCVGRHFEVDRSYTHGVLLNIYKFKRNINLYMISQLTSKDMCTYWNNLWAHVFAFFLQLIFEKLLIPKNLQRITLKSPQKIMQTFMWNISYHHQQHLHSDVQTGFCPLPDIIWHSKNMSCNICLLTSLLNSRLVCCSL